MSIDVPQSLQERIDAVDWYHEFDFGNGLRATSKSRDVASHRVLWGFIEAQLERIDFRNKTVLDVGCWDGYWSFYAERRGAASVLATDDATQNWATGQGLHLAKQLLNSSITVDQSVSIYELTRLGKTFDIILCLGVYYHLIDPFLAFAQLRHCCHRGSLVVLEGDAAISLWPDTIYWEPGDASQSIFIPTPYALKKLLQTAYLEVLSQTWHAKPLSPSRYRSWGMCAAVLGLRAAATVTPWRSKGRMFTICAPFEGDNPLHPYRPPFGLARYDSRFNR